MSGFEHMHLCIVQHLVLLDCLLSLCDSFSMAFLVPGKLINCNKICCSHHCQFGYCQIVLDSQDFLLYFAAYILGVYVLFSN